MVTVTATDMAMVTDNLKNEDKNRCENIGFLLSVAITMEEVSQNVSAICGRWTFVRLPLLPIKIRSCRELTLAGAFSRVYSKIP